MEDSKIYIHYLYHSGFAVEMQEQILVFDYYPHEKTRQAGLPDGIITQEDILNWSKAYVFVSHSHHDHYHPDIFTWQTHPDIHYILSSDISQNTIKTSAEHCFFMDPYETIEMEGLTVRTFGSTDLGVSFLVNAQGFRIFHAGDLNWWHWADESTQEELAEAECEFKREVSRIQGEAIDLAFFPVDPRLGPDYHRGGNYFIETLRPKWFFPMHFADRADITEAFAAQRPAEEAKPAVIRKRGEVFAYNTI